MPIPFHCHECDTPTMNKNGLCDNHQPVGSISDDVKKKTLMLGNLNQKEIKERGRNCRDNTEG